MMEKKLPFDRAFIEDLAKQYPTPFHIYDERAIRENCRALHRSFSWAPGFREFFAVKATPNPHIMKVLMDEGCGADCSSMAELELARRTGIEKEGIFFSSNDTPAEEYVRARELGAVINLDDISHIDYLERHAGLPEVLSFRYNPGPRRTGNAIIGKPEEAKYGLTREQISEAYRTVKGKGVTRFGLHTMVASNELNPDYFVETARMLFEVAAEVSAEAGIRFEFVNLGGGFGIPYRPGDRAIDMDYVAGKIAGLYKSTIESAGLHPLKIFMESGRMMTGPYGWLVTRAIHTKKTYRDYIGVDACMANLMRPGMYGAYHHITVLGREDAPRDRVYDVTGSLCENNDKFAIARELPAIVPGDLLVIHDTGAHGHAMGFNYNGKLRSAELLLREDGSVKLIRRAETLDDLFATLDFSSL